jgi:Homing endonuclease associated repeat
MIEALIAAYEETGGWPSSTGWARATAKHPASRTYIRLFGSWPAAIAAAEAVMMHGRGLGRPLPEPDPRSPKG